MRELTTILETALRAISETYFQVRIDGGSPVYRERVYCYELYHQMRKLWPGDTAFVLNGELDKAAHPILCDLGADYAKPDLLVHGPGDMSRNHAIIEVKRASAPADGIRKDLETLSLFRTRVRYDRAIYLVFGPEATNAVARIRAVARGMGELPSIELWLHSTPGGEASHRMLDEPIGNDEIRNSVPAVVPRRGR